MKINTAFLSTILIQLAVIAAGEIYVVQDISGPGTVTVTATKVYNIWNNGGNSTKYKVDIVSPFINSPG